MSLNKAIATLTILSTSPATPDKIRLEIDNAIAELSEVEEIPVGYWVKDEEASEFHIEPIYVCSNCNGSVWGRGECTRHCPHCGSLNIEIKEEEDE
ncbi:MAG: hypothetical protein IJI45_16655 [Anaerolineaceae bacterium]|nr:hypothetical protein [Anaerolineaceae bacterium]